MTYIPTPGPLEGERYEVGNGTAVKERPILFSAPMVRAILAGTKTQTRRLVKPQPIYAGGAWKCADGSTHQASRPSKSLLASCPYGQPGDRLWVRETLKPWTQDPELFAYAADDTRVQGDGYNFPVKPGRPYVPSIHLARCWSRITLEVTRVRVERLQEISEPDAAAEGVREWAAGACAKDNPNEYTDVGYYSLLWEQINGAGSWAANPWVWVLEFRKC